MIAAANWQLYDRLLHVLDERPGIRLTYDRGELEIRIPSNPHKLIAHRMDRLIFVLIEEFNKASSGGGTTTLRRRENDCGLDPDECYWFETADLIRDRMEIDLTIDPPPGLVVEVTRTASALNRRSIFQRLGVAEIWRTNGRQLRFFALDSNGRYEEIPASRQFHPVSPPDILRFIALWRSRDDTTIVRQFREWVRQQIAANPPAPPTP